MLVIFYGSFFFVNVPIADSINVIEKLLVQDNQSADLAKIVEKCLTFTHLLIEGIFSNRSLSQVVNNIFIEVFEAIGLENVQLVALCLSPNPRSLLSYRDREVRKVLTKHIRQKKTFPNSKKRTIIPPFLFLTAVVY